MPEQDEELTMQDIRIRALNFAGVKKSAEAAQITYQTATKYAQGGQLRKSTENWLAIGVYNTLAEKEDELLRQLNEAREMKNAALNWVHEIQG